MRKTSICMLLVILLIMLIPTAMAYEEGVETETQDIVISTGDDAISVREDLTIKGESNASYSIITFWVQDEAEDISILVNNNKAEYTSSDNEYICNISSLNIKMNTSMQAIISYNLGKDIEEFKKTVIRNTTSLSVIFDENIIYTAENLLPGVYFTLRLYTPTETPLSGYIVVAIMLLVILLVVSTVYLLRKQGTKIRDIGIESEELLNTKKSLLMSLLKDIEKQHRSKQISDDTYHKLKEQYKQQAVETMKKLEDMKSKIK